jgi:hypothetical protein
MGVSEIDMPRQIVFPVIFRAARIVASARPLRSQLTGTEGWSIAAGTSTAMSSEIKLNEPAEDKMKRILLQILLAIAGLLMLFRFGMPALVFGATGPGPFGNRWLEEGTPATLLLDADLRFFGAMMIGIGIVFFWTISKIEAVGPLIYILAGAVAFGAAARIYALIRFGSPGTAGIIPIVIEAVSPVLIVILRYYVAKDIK